MYIHNNNNIIFCKLHCIHYNIHIYIATIFGPMVVYIYIYIKLYSIIIIYIYIYGIN